MNNIQEFLKSCSKDEESYKKLVKFADELIQQREQIKNHLDLLERAIKSDYDSIVITTLELEKPGPRIIYVNDGFTKMTGYSREEAIGETPRILQGPKTDRAVLDTLKKRLKDGNSFFGHTVNYRKDGSEFINQWDIHPLTNDRGEITHWVSYQHDITERKRSEKKVVDTQLEFDRLAEESKKTLIDIDEQGNIITSNKAFRDLIGYDDEELKKKKVWELLSDKQVESFKHKFDKFKPSDFDGVSHNLTISTHKGLPVEVKVNTRLLTIDDQTVVRAAFENKSLQKRIMAMLNKSGSSLDKMFDITKDFRYKLKEDNGSYKFSYVSDSFTAITGISTEDAESMTLKELVHDEDQQKLSNHLKTILSGKPNTEQFRIRGEGGKFIAVIDYAKPVWDDDRENVEEIKGSISTEISSAKTVSKN
ncbi:MAG: PAS domain S-box protein [Balneolaceae bacterium]|nr:MAG: PAS domain S-box protein [Balneolaceae bacterium]